MKSPKTMTLDAEAFRFLKSELHERRAGNPGWQPTQDQEAKVRMFFAHRKEHSWSMEEFCDKIGVTRNALRRYARKAGLL